MDGPREYHTKGSKSERERQIPSSAYLWNLKYGADAPTCKPERLAHTEARRVLVKQEKGSGEGRWGVWGLQMQPVIQRTDKQQGPIVYTTGNFLA